jgi:hypothetical protein
LTQLLGTGSYFFSNREPVSTQDVLRVPTSREAAIRRRESRSEATQRRRIADERWVVASRGEGEVKVVRLGKPDFDGFLILKIVKR